MPQSKVGCIRVTHPCATRHQVLLPVLPFDLHVLGLPLALILSQDQTLHSKKENLILFRLIIPKKLRKFLGYLLLSLLQTFKELYLISRSFRDRFFQIGLQKYNHFFTLQNIFLKSTIKIINIPLLITVIAR